MIPQSTNPELGNVATPLRSLTDCHPKLYWPPHFRSRITSKVTIGGHGEQLTTGVHSHLHPYPMRAGAHTHPTRTRNGTSRRALRTDSRVPWSHQRRSAPATKQATRGLLLTDRLSSAGWEGGEKNYNRNFYKQ